MNMKKISAIIAVLVLAVAFTGCKKAGGSGACSGIDSHFHGDHDSGTGSTGSALGCSRNKG